jgi:cytosine/adenosine deaminase-related metal-dependent hydrolase
MPIEQAYRARWVFPPESEPISDATMIVVDGILTDITTQHVPTAKDLGSAAILPGLVNAHVHLEFSSLSAPIAPPLPFTDWIRSVIRSRQTEDSRESSLLAGIQECLQTETTAVGEIATSPLSTKQLDDCSLAGVVFHEVIGISEQAAREKGNQLTDLLTEYRPQRDQMNLGLSPHAPYSVHPDLLQKIVQLSRSEHCPLAMHLAENRAERELIGSCEGEFRSFLEEIELWPGDVWQEFRTINDYLRLLAQADSALIVHGNDFQSNEIEFLATQSQMSVVYCPRTHAYFQHSQHPLPHLLNHDINVALGTDGRSSNPDLDLWQDARHVRQTFPDLSPREVINLATTNGVRALKLPSDGLTLGEQARWSVISVDRQSSESDPWHLLFA